MKRWAIIHAASGAIVSFTSRQSFRPRAGMIVEDAPQPVTSDTHWWDGSDYAARQDASISLPVTVAEPGAALAITTPASAWYARTDGTIVNAATVTIQGGYKQNSFTLVGKFRGATSIDVVAAGAALGTVQADLLAKVKFEAERRKMASFSAGNGKAQEYVQKGKEASTSATVLASVLNALTAANAAAQYPMAHAERTLTGETLSVVLARYRAGKASSDAELARLSAIEWKSVQAIKSASTAAAKQAAYAAINWNQSL